MSDTGATGVEVVGDHATDDGAADLIERLDDENEHYLRVTMDLRNLLEDAVNREVALERENAGLRRRIADLERGLDSVMTTATMRITRPLRFMWSKLRLGLGRG